jgi:hypothetical protein
MTSRRRRTRSTEPRVGTAWTPGPRSRECLPGFTASLTVTFNTLSGPRSPKCLPGLNLWIGLRTPHPLGPRQARPAAPAHPWTHATGKSKRLLRLARGPRDWHESLASNDEGPQQAGEPSSKATRTSRACSAWTREWL